MLGYLLTALCFVFVAAIAFWWIRRGYRSQNRLKREAEYAREVLASSSRQLTADLHSVLEKKQISVASDFTINLKDARLANDKQDGRLYALIPFHSDKQVHVLLARWTNGKWKGTPIVEENCEVNHALEKHSDSLIPLN